MAAILLEILMHHRIARMAFIPVIIIINFISQPINPLGNKLTHMMHISNVLDSRGSLQGINGVRLHNFHKASIFPHSVGVSCCYFKSRLLRKHSESFRTFPISTYPFSLGGFGLGIQ